MESEWNLWVWLVDGICGCGYQEVGVVNRCCCKEVYRFPHITYPYSTCISSFLKQHPYFFVYFFNVFCSLYKRIIKY